MTNTPTPSDNHAAPATEAEDTNAFWEKAIVRAATMPPDLMMLLGSESDQIDNFHSHVTLSIRTERIDKIEAAIRAQVRKEIAEEVREAHYEKYCDAKLFTDYKCGELSGLAAALRIIERGAATEGQG